MSDSEGTREVKKGIFTMYINDNLPTPPASKTKLKQKKKEKKLTSTKKVAAEKAEEVKEEATAEKTGYSSLVGKLASRYVILGAVLISTGVGVGIGSYLSKTTTNIPTEVIMLDKDLNNDRIPDAYLQLSGGHKIPLYGRWSGSGNSIAYLTAEEMKQIYPNRGTDYKNIEDLLNQNTNLQMVRDQDSSYTNY